MSFIAFFLTMLAALSQASPDKAQEKRSPQQHTASLYSQQQASPYQQQSPLYTKNNEIPSYVRAPAGPAYRKAEETRPAYQRTVEAGPAYTKSLQALLQKSGPAIPQQEYQQVYQYVPQAEQPQAVAYAQPANLGKYAQTASAPVQKYAYITQPQTQQHTQYSSVPQYSSAAEVSSFSYSSPVVAYNNHGLLQQLAGKSAAVQRTPASYNAVPSAKVQYQPAAKVQYVPTQGASRAYAVSQNDYPSAQGYLSASSGYSAAPAQQSASNAYPSTPSDYSTSQNALAASADAYSQSPSAYSSPSGNYEGSSDAYQQISQKALFSSAQAQPQAVTYESNPGVGQKVTYVKSPAPAAYQAKQSAQIAYVNEQSAQQYSAQAAASPSYESGAETAQQYYLSPQAAQSQIYAVPDQAKYSRSGVTYA